MKPIRGTTEKMSIEIVYILNENDEMTIYLDKPLQIQTLHYTHTKLYNHKHLNKPLLYHWTVKAT